VLFCYNHSYAKEIIMTPTELEKVVKQLRNSISIFDIMQQRTACRILAADSGVETIPHLVWALSAKDAQVRDTADVALRALKPGASCDVLCEEALCDLSGPAAKLCIESDKRPSNPERLCLFLFVTHQLDAYFKEDFEFQSLRLEYERANSALQTQVMEVVRSGDRRCLGFFGSKKPLTECKESEIRLAIESAVRHQDWAGLFQAFLDLPLKYGFPLIEIFRKSGWTPNQPELRGVLTQVLKDAKGQVLPAPDAKATSSVFTKWLEQGRTGELAGMTADALIQRLSNATPPEGVAIVGALRDKITAGSQQAQTIMSSQHWLVRLAGHAIGLAGSNLTSDKVTDNNYWVSELASFTGILDLWPARATPDDLESLKKSPPEAWTGKLGAARRVLQTLLGYRITTGAFEVMEIEAGEFTGVFEKV
jgi:hypothetical protein